MKVIKEIFKEIISPYSGQIGIIMVIITDLKHEEFTHLMSGGEKKKKVVSYYKVHVNF